MRVFGDIHGRTFDFREACLQYNGPCFQLGDFGIGFNQQWDEAQKRWLKENPKVKFMRGNHDCYEVCKQVPGFVDDGFYDENTGIMYIGGAWSIDYHNRTVGIDWWEDEQITDERFQQIMDDVCRLKPRIIISHDGPGDVTEEMFLKRGGGLGGNSKRFWNRTSDWLDRIYQKHEPYLWLYGHWHVNTIQKIRNTTFVCVGQQDFLDLDLNTLEFKFSGHCRVLDYSGEAS